MNATSKSISRKITWMNLLVSGAALLLAGSAFFAYDQVTFRQSLVHALSAQAQIIGSNSVSALLFNDPQSAAATLSALKSSPHVESAGIFSADRGIFATYSRKGCAEVLSIPALNDNRKEAFRFAKRNL